MTQGTPILLLGAYGLAGEAIARRARASISRAVQAFQNSRRGFWSPCGCRARDCPAALASPAESGKEEHGLCVDVVDGERERLAEAQSTGVNE